jgi:hypothetical protein
MINNKQIICSANSCATQVTLGYIELDILSEGVLELTEEDLAVVEASVGGAGGVEMGMTGTQVRRELEPVVYENALAQNYPNPFNPSTTIAYSVATKTRVRLEIFDVRGRLVKSLVDERKSPNNYQVIWDGRNGDGESVASGVYFYRLVAGDFRATKNLVLLR